MRKKAHNNEIILNDQKAACQLIVKVIVDVKAKPIDMPTGSDITINEIHKDLVFSEANVQDHTGAYTLNIAIGMPLNILIAAFNWKIGMRVKL